MIKCVVFVWLIMLYPRKLACLVGALAVNPFMRSDFNHVGFSCTFLSLEKDLVFGKDFWFCKEWKCILLNVGSLLPAFCSEKFLPFRSPWFSHFHQDIQCTLQLPVATRWISGLPS